MSGLALFVGRAGPCVQRDPAFTAVARVAVVSGRTVAVLVAGVALVAAHRRTRVREEVTEEGAPALVALQVARRAC